MRYLDLIQESIDYIEDNLKTDIAVEELSRKAGFSLFHYYRLFQQVVGLPVKQYIVWRRLLWVAYEMAQGKRQVDAALEYGFDTSAGLYKAFRRAFGCAPSEYVKRFRIQKPYRIHLLQGEFVMIAHNRISQVLKNWNVDGNTVENIVYQDSGEINPNVFLVDGRYILKLFGVPGTANCNAQILEALHRAGISDGAPVKTLDGNQVATDGELYYVLTNRIAGEAVSAEAVFSDETGETAQYLGAVIGLLHQVLRENDHIVCNERNIYEEVCSCWLEPAAKAMELPRQFLDDYRETFGKLHGSLPVQIIHRDPNPSNIIMREGKCAGFVDFDLSQRSIRLFDPCYAATALLVEAFSRDPEGMLPKWKDVFRGIILGYDSVAHLTEAEKSALPYVVFSIQLICVGFFSTQEKYRELTKTNAAMLRWLMEHRDIGPWRCRRSA